MIPHIFYHLGIWTAFFCMCCLFGFSSCTPNVTDAPQIPIGHSSCYQGTIESNLKGQIPLDAEGKLTTHPCDPIPTTVAPTTVAPTTQAGSGKQKPGSVVTTVGPATARNVSCTALLYFNNGGKVTTDVTWTVNFTCGTSEDCPQTIGKQFCCSGPDCNSLQFFQKSSRMSMATVDSCLTGSQTSADTGSLVVSRKCQGASHYCYNSTKDDKTSFGCALDKQCQSSSPSCSEDSNFTVCCCDSNDCNGSPHNALVHPTSIVPLQTTSRLVTVNKTYSNWMLITFIAAGFLIGGLMGVFVMVLCRRWKRKRAHGPLQISYSRVSADLTNEDDDNVFSY
ncbi:uncharacterized protein LOC117294791 [Asterias rubens]|uniref:uncharacterized protein LOC117294791 n=1 Tax=Asterias rubens TaxID=7604 RepID=UPI001455AB54|nr:uncharacterized protein LOC117294791 [Asterias rubens]